MLQVTVVHQSCICLAATPETVKKMWKITIIGVCVGSMYSLYWENEEENPRTGKKYDDNYRFWDTTFYRINLQKRCTTGARLYD